MLKENTKQTQESSERKRSKLNSPASWSALCYPASCKGRRKHKQARQRGASRGRQQLIAWEETDGLIHSCKKTTPAPTWLDSTYGLKDLSNSGEDQNQRGGPFKRPTLSGPVKLDLSSKQICQCSCKDGKVEALMVAYHAENHISFFLVFGTKKNIG